MYKSLAYLEGQEVEWLTKESEFRTPDRCIVVKDYENSVLLGFIYEKDVYGRSIAQRRICHLISKAAMYCGDVLIRANTLLTGDEIYDIG